MFDWDWKTGATWGAVALSLLSLYVGLVANKKTRFINTVTNQRVLWIEQLRQDFAKFVGLAGNMVFDQSKGRVVAKSPEHRLELHRLRRVITLRLNPKDAEDQEIQTLLPQIQTAAFDNDLTLPQARLDDLTSLAQALLKREWDKVKLEAENGRLDKVADRPVRYHLSKAWAAFCEKFRRVKPVKAAGSTEPRS